MDATTTTHAVECHAIKKVFGSGASEVRALRGIDLTIQQGEVMMLVGPSGCGKTTLISTIAGVLDPSEGECLVFGQNLHHMTEEDRTQYRGQHIGFVFQQFNLIGSLPLRQNVAIPLLINGTGYADALRKADEALEKVGLGDRTMSRPRTFRGASSSASLSPGPSSIPRTCWCVMNPPARWTTSPGNGSLSCCAQWRRVRVGR